MLKVEVVRMVLDDYIAELEKIRAMYGGDLEVKTQTLTHRWAAELPAIRMQTVGKREVPFVLLNP